MIDARRTWIASIVVIGLLASCIGDVSNPLADGPSRSGSISGMILNENGEVLSGPVLLWVVAVATAPYQRLSFTQADRTKEFNLRSLRPGQWTLTFTGIHGWTFVFPELQLYPDTSVVVQVVAGEETVIPAVKLRPRAPLLLVALETCPWALPDPPSVDDWGQCDGGYWGGAAALITVTGVAGTSTAEFRSTGAIGPASYTAPPTRWDTTPWSTHFDIKIAGDYDVTIALTPDPLRPTWRLVPWQTMTTRVTVGRGLSYVEFDFWYK